MQPTAAKTTLEAYLQPLSDAKHEVSDQHGAAVVENQLLDIWSRLEQVVLHERSNFLEARAWLSTTLCKLSVVPGSVRRECLYPFVELSGRQLRGGVQAPTLQLLQLWCERRPQQAGQLLADYPRIMKAFFKDSQLRITLWFAHFSMQGLSGFKYGAYALARYALANRQDVWHQLVWRGRHPQAPIAVAAKPHYFCELDIVPTVQNLLQDCPDFWSSDVWRECLQSGDIIGIDYGWFCNHLLELLQGEDDTARMVERALKDFVAEEDFSLLGQRLLHLLQCEQLLQLVNSLSQCGSPLAAKMTANEHSSVQELLPVMFCKVRWRTIDQVLLCHALACCRSQLKQMLQQDEEAAEQLLQLQQQATQLHDYCNAAAHQRWLWRLHDLDSPDCVRLLLLHAWTLQLALTQQAGRSPSALPELLRSHDIQFEQLQAVDHPSSTVRAASGSSPVKVQDLEREAIPTASTLDQSSLELRDPPLANDLAPGVQGTSTEPGISAEDIISQRQGIQSHLRGRSKHKKRRRKHKEKGSRSKQKKHKKKRLLKSASGGSKKRARSRRKSSSNQSGSSSSENCDSSSGSDGWLEPGHGTIWKVGGGEDEIDGDEDVGLHSPWMLTSWRVQLGAVSVVGTATDVVDFLVCYALRTWITRRLGG